MITPDVVGGVVGPDRLSSSSFSSSMTEQGSCSTLRLSVVSLALRRL